MAQEIPIHRSQLTSKPLNVDLSNETLAQENVAYAQSAARNQQETLELSLKNSYAKYKNLAQRQIFEAFSNHPTDPEQFEKSVRDRTGEITKGAPYAIRGEIESWINTNAIGYLAKVQNNRMRVLNVDLEKEKLGEIQMNSESLNALASGVISDDEQIRSDSLTSLGGNLSNIIEAFSTVGLDGQPLFTANQQVTGAKKIMDKFSLSVIQAGYENKKTLEEKIQYVEDLENGNISIPAQGPDGTIIETDALGGLTNGQVSSLVSRMQSDIKATQNEIEKQNYLNWIQSTVDGTAVADPADPDYRKVVNEAYSNVLRPELKNLPLDARADRMIKFVDDNAMMPKVMVDELSTWINSGNEQQMLTAARFIGKAKQENLPALRSFNDKDLAKAYEMERAINAGIRPQEAMDLIQKIQDPETEAVYQNRRRLFNENLKRRKPDFEKMAAKAAKAGFLTFGRGKFPEETEVGEMAALDYKTLIENAFLLTNDWKKAQEIADTKFGVLWNVSETNNGKLMKIPPEAYYDTSFIKPDAMREQLKEDLRFIKDDVVGSNIDFNETSAILVTDRQTIDEAESTGEPSYIVKVRNDLGIPVTLEVNNKPFRWKPDMNQLSLLRNIELQQQAVSEEKSENERHKNLKLMEIIVRSFPTFLDYNKDARELIERGIEQSVHEPELNFLYQLFEKFWEKNKEAQATLRETIRANNKKFEEALFVQ